MLLWYRGEGAGSVASPLKVYGEIIYAESCSSKFNIHVCQHPSAMVTVRKHEKCGIKM